MAIRPDKMLRCPACLDALSWDLFNLDEWQHCPACRKLLRASVFPSMYRQDGEGKTGETISEDDEATCFYHEEKRAEQVCESCGRFLCALCDVDFGGKHICPRCIEAGQSKENKEDKLVTRRTLYDDMALLFATVPVLMFLFPSLVMAPVTIVVAIWYWRRPSSLIPRTKIRFIFALLLASVEIVGWYAFFRYTMI